MLSPFPRNNPLPVPPTETETHPPNDEGGSQLEIFIIMSATAPDLVLCDIQTPETRLWPELELMARGLRWAGTRQVVC